MYLRNVHVGLSAPHNCTQTSVVVGDYDYYHYEVDGFKDCGWGCGYRTLQTLLSWCILNVKEFSSYKVLCISEIQETLVAVQDKGMDWLVRSVLGA